MTAIKLEHCTLTLEEPEFKNPSIDRVQTMAQISTAISLKRIADFFEKWDKEHDDSELQFSRD